MSEDLLQAIQTLQFTDKAGAENLLLQFMRDALALDVVKVELRPLAVSLNSFNGFLTLAEGKRLFFKTHTEPDSVIGEYYRAELLAEAGYPVIQPVFSSKDAGRQLLIYEVIDDPSVFDLAWIIEGGNAEETEVLEKAQCDADDALLQIYLQTLVQQSPEEASEAAVHQLFYHRLTQGRLSRFYGLPADSNNAVLLPNGLYLMGDVQHVQWVINGQHYQETLSDLITKADRLLHPAQSGPSIVGHGDAHNGNVFFRREEQSLLYFDPAFAGSHHPLLDLTKPLFHNVFAMWMYFPLDKSDQLRIDLQVVDGVWHVEHDYTLHPIREMFLQSKVNRVLIPILIELKQRGWLRHDWRSYLKAALFCCPLLTMNLTDSQKFPPAISLLGLAMSVEMGAESKGQRSHIDDVLDEAEKSLS